MTKDEIVEALQGFPIGPGEVDSIAETMLPLFRAQAEKAWDEGHDHYGKHFSPSMPEFGKNPYTVQSETDGTAPKTD